jgi:hypothetical protein
LQVQVNNPVPDHRLISLIRFRNFAHMLADLAHWRDKKSIAIAAGPGRERFAGDRLVLKIGNMRPKVALSIFLAHTPMDSL